MPNPHPRHRTQREYVCLPHCKQRYRNQYSCVYIIDLTTSLSLIFCPFRGSLNAVQRKPNPAKFKPTPIDLHQGYKNNFGNNQSNQHHCIDCNVWNNQSNQHHYIDCKLLTYRNVSFDCTIIFREWYLVHSFWQWQHFTLTVWLAETSISSHWILFTSCYLYFMWPVDRFFCTLLTYPWFTHYRDIWWVYRHKPCMRTTSFSCVLYCNTWEQYLAMFQL